MASMRRTRQYRSQSDRRRTLHRAILCAAALSLAAAGEASAQFAYGYMRVYPGPAYEDDLAPIAPRAVVYRLRDRGFTEIARPRFDGRAYVVDATNPAGSRVRLFVDARDGGVIGRERLDAPYYPSARVARAAPGYGWTEEDAAPRRGGRDSEALLPPGDIPLPRPSLNAGIDRAPGSSPRPGTPDASTFGVNPDARAGAKAQPAPRRTAKLIPPAKPAAPRAAPEAPVPPTSPSEQPTPNAKAAPDAAKPSEAAKPPESAKAAIEPQKDAPAPLTAAAKLPIAAEKPADTPSAAPTAEKPAADKQSEKTAAAKDGANQGWQDPPTADQKRNVRVIGGAIVVPGGGAEAAPPAAN